VFPIVLVQLFITSVLLTIGGLCLHTALRSDRHERQSMLLLRTLTRLEQQLRADERESRLVAASSASEMTFADLSGQRGVATWRTDRGIVERIEGDLSSPNARETYVFPAGYSVEFVVEPGSVVVRIFEGAPLVKYRESASGGLARGAAAESPAAAESRRTPGRLIEIRLSGGRGGVQ
jgi:hypothetical protein